MTVFVDSITEYPVRMIKKEARRFGKKWCHMVTDGDMEELHRMAEKIGLKRSFFQNPKHNSSLPHYDLVPSKRSLALRYGAKEISIRDLAKLIKKNREKK